MAIHVNSKAKVLSVEMRELIRLFDLAAQKKGLYSVVEGRFAEEAAANVAYDKAKANLEKAILKREQALVQHVKFAKSS